ncbi:SseB family protein [Micromonospora thermarum]|uniref:SseB family protein n=1 Tax=Micromonospora thermarum TaxID=2720024 RepID=A0ABX0ZF77_9ACTN|nr:SseB family protein [Micromonospora thermarum]NJP34560.1 SseB family protein [Micromonospora thermarum]
MTSGWPDLVARLHDTLGRCGRDTDLDLAAGDRRLRLMVRRDTVRGVCPGYDAGRLAGLGWQPPGARGGWWFETPRTPPALRWWSDFAVRTAAAVLTDDPDALSCRVAPPAVPPQGPEPARDGAEPARDGAEPTAAGRDDGSPDIAGPVAGKPAGGGGERPGWPAADGAVRERLVAAAGRRDLAGYLAVLAGAVVCVPLTAEPSPERGFPWAVVTDPDGAPLLPVFTSPEALTAFAGPGVPFVAVPCAELFADWPDGRWGLAVDAGSPAAVTLAAPALAALLAANVPTA